MDITQMLGQPGPGQGIPPGQGITGPMGMGQNGMNQDIIPFLMMLLEALLGKQGGAPGGPSGGGGMPFTAALGGGGMPGGPPGGPPGMPPIPPGM